MTSSYHLLRIRARNRPGVITTIASALASRGVNIEGFAVATGAAGSEEDGRFVVLIEVDSAYAALLRQVLQCFEVVLEVEEPMPLDEASLAEWRTRFEQAVG